MDNNNTLQNQVPVIPESEMKLPEEQYQDATPTPAKEKSIGTVLLILLVVLLMAATAAVIFYGEELVNMILPAEEVETPMPPMDTPPPENEEANIENMEAEIENMDFSDMESELNEIEAEIEAEATATTTS